MTPRRVLVTGGAGFIGSNIVARLAEDNALEVAVCDWLGEAETGKWRNLAKHPVSDLMRPEEMWRWLEKCGGEVEAIIHTGAISSTTEPDVDKVMATNFGLSRDLFDWCARNQRRFIYASSAATYGDGAGGFDDEQDPRALAALRPLNPYGWSKALFDLYAARQAEAGRAPPQWAGLKFFNVYGPNEEHKGPMRSVASQIWPDIAAGRSVRLFRSYREPWPDGGQKRDFIYVRDVAEIVAWLVANPRINGVFNVGTGTARTFQALAEAVFKAAGREPRIDYVAMPEAIRARYQYFTQARIERLRQAGYVATLTSLEDGIGDYVTRYLSQPDPYR